MLAFTLSTKAGQLEVESLNMHTRFVSNEFGLSSDRSVEIGLVKEMAVCDWRFLGHFDEHKRELPAKDL